MAMRVTTKMMQNTSLNNLNTNKALQEKLTTQMSTQKKITRPSDDPVVAIRSLRLNASLDKIDQYYEKNCSDADSWLTLTESAIDTATDLLTDMKVNITQAANGYLKAEDRQTIMENLTNYKKEFYATGNADSAGRSIFTGYRTDSSLTFQSDKTERYEIIEQRNNTFLDTTTFVKTLDLSAINEGNFKNINTTEYEVGTYEIPRIRTSYANLDIEKELDENGNVLSYSGNATLSYMVNTPNAYVTDALGTQHKGTNISTSYGTVFINELATTQGQLSILVDGQEYNLTKGTEQTITTASGDALKISFDLSKGEAGISVSELDANGDEVRYYNLDAVESVNDLGQPIYDFDDTYEAGITVTDYYESATDDAYQKALDDPDAIVYIAETGEMLLGSNIYTELSKLSQDTELRIGYEKSNWQAGDTDPIHYFYSVREDELKGEVVYNADKLEGTAAEQIISYDIGSNQTIRVNTTADEVFTHNVGRDIDEMVAMLDEFQTLDTAYTTVDDMIKSEQYEGDELEKLETQLAALEKAKTLLGDKIQAASEALQTKFNQYIEDSTLAFTDCGSRSSRLKLIENRLLSQQTNFQELVSENEDADITDLAIQLSSVKLTYEAALSSISYVMQTTLLDYI